MTIVHHGLRRLGWTPEDVRRAMLQQGASTAEPARSDEIAAKSHQHLRTAYLDGPAQRDRIATLKVNEAFILGRLLRGISPKCLAVGLMVTDEAIYKRARSFGLTRSVSNRG